MAVNKVYKIPRNILAEMTKNNPQAIAALENSQNMAERTPQEIEDIIIQINSAVDKAEQSAIVATQSSAIAQQLLSDLVPQLNAVSVPQAQIDVLNAVSVTMDCPIQLMPI